MKPGQLLQKFIENENSLRLVAFLNSTGPGSICLQGLAGSASAVLTSAVSKKTEKSFLCILPDRETAFYFFNDLENLLEEKTLSQESRSVFLFPGSFKKPYEVTLTDNAQVLMRAEVVNRLATSDQKTLIVTYPEAIGERVVARKSLEKNLLGISRNELLSVDFLMDALNEFGFERTEFVVEPGQYSLRGGIVDVFSFSNDYPFRLEIVGDRVESLRLFDPESQLSVKALEKVSLLPDITHLAQSGEVREFILDSMPKDTVVWCNDLPVIQEKLTAGIEKARNIYHTLHKDIKHLTPKELFIDADEFGQKLALVKVIDNCPSRNGESAGKCIVFECSPQPAFNKNFDLIVENLLENKSRGIRNIIFSDNQRQIDRFFSIFESISNSEGLTGENSPETILVSLHQGFIDRQIKVACYTDHQFFERYQRYKVRDKFAGKQAMTFKEFNNLKPGDFITHIDHGIGIFSGLEKIEVNGKIQEAIRLVYKDNDVLYISIHSLHRISRYSGKEGSVPTLHRLGSNTWANLKNKTKNKVKDIAKDLIKLYAKRRTQEGFQFSHDTYLQNELEASFIYEDTPDQEKATRDVKSDMEAPFPMDRLLCGDVGFGKTEIAIRAAFKAVCDSKQAAVLVPTTILALQHYYTFTERLKDLPCKVEYISRFRTQKEIKQVLSELSEGRIDIIIGTHRLISKDVKFKDLGLLVIDEEQKFGVATKEKLKELRVNVDTLTLTATPIPRTLQFSMMGARDLSLIHTPPPNRYPVVTELHVFNKDMIREAILYEVSRGGQVFFIHNRVQNILEMAGMIQEMCPDVNVVVGHGQMEGEKLEKVMIDFINGQADVLVATTIIESGLDIPNANTIIINQAHHFGLSDLHQMRGRVGRSNKKAFCYLITPPLGTLTDEARKRLRTLEEFSDLGSGFNISMRDLDIRGAGNLLGAEQSGFIAEIGFETYQKILDEAIAELKEQEFKELFEESTDGKAFMVAECLLETDLELMIPSEYVTNVEERINLYKEIDSLDSDATIETFSMQMADRFGPLPQQVSGLLNAVRFRWESRKAGFEKVILKSNILIGYFVARQESPYFESPVFRKVLRFVQNNPRRCLLKENNGRLSLTIRQVASIEKALDLAREILETRADT
ncbi:MAG TPA: transcription-repair coupling factor [Bacteroidales bacterium]|nr:transcription-repair coupling factor [Bacteroidales bacterium]